MKPVRVSENVTVCEIVEGQQSDEMLDWLATCPDEWDVVDGGLRILRDGAEPSHGYPTDFVVQDGSQDSSRVRSNGREVRWYCLPRALMPPMWLEKTDKERNEV